MAKSFGAWAFLIGVILAVILGLITQGNFSNMWVWILVLIGLVVGLLNVTDKEVTPFMMAGVVLVIVSSLGSAVMDSIPLLNGILMAMLLLFVPATIIVAIKSVFALARD